MLRFVFLICWHAYQVCARGVVSGRQRSSRGGRLVLNFFSLMIKGFSPHLYPLGLCFCMEQKASYSQCMYWGQGGAATSNRGEESRWQPPAVPPFEGSSLGPGRARAYRGGEAWPLQTSPHPILLSSSFKTLSLEKKNYVLEAEFSHVTGTLELGYSDIADGSF